jgi:Ca-activated chloride channel family protein
VLVLVTDGQIGNEDQILRELGRRLAGIRVFTLGIDRAVNEGFLNRLAALGGGSCEVVETEERLDEVMDSVHRRIGTPVLTALHLEPAGLRFDPSSVVPGRLPDLFAGVPLLILGRFRGNLDGGILLQGRDAGGEWSQRVLATATANPALACTWARGQLRKLEDRYLTGPGDRGGLERQIVETSLRFNVLCRFTAFVAVDRSEVANEGGKLLQVVQPVEAPQGWEMHALKCAAYAGAASELAALSSGPRMALRGLLPSSRKASEKRQPGVLRRMADEVARRLSGRGKDRSAPPDPTPAQRRAAEMLKDMRSAAADARLQKLRDLSRPLTALLDELRALGVGDAVLQPLARAAEDVRQLLGGARREEADVDRVWSALEKALEGVSGAPRGAVWK